MRIISIAIKIPQSQLSKPDHIHVHSFKYYVQIGDQSSTQAAHIRARMKEKILFHLLHDKYEVNTQVLSISYQLGNVCI